jgi:hypothetical protein
MHSMVVKIVGIDRFNDPPLIHVRSEDGHILRVVCSMLRHTESVATAAPVAGSDSPSTQASTLEAAQKLSSGPAHPHQRVSGVRVGELWYHGNRQVTVIRQMGCVLLKHAFLLNEVRPWRSFNFRFQRRNPPARTPMRRSEVGSDRCDVAQLRLIDVT